MTCPTILTSSGRRSPTPHGARFSINFAAGHERRVRSSSGFHILSRFGVMKHLDVLREAGLVNTRKEGRKRVNTLNAVPLRMIYERWVSRYEDLWASMLTGLKRSVEDERET